PTRGSRTRTSRLRSTTLPTCWSAARGELAGANRAAGCAGGCCRRPSGCLRVLPDERNGQSKRRIGVALPRLEGLRRGELHRGGGRGLSGGCQRARRIRAPARSRSRVRESRKPHARCPLSAFLPPAEQRNGSRHV